jgi:hypothetical protein
LTNRPIRGTDFRPDLLQLLDLADRRVERLQPRQRIAPHFGGAGASELQHRVEQGTALKAERPRAGAKRAQKHETAQPLMGAGKDSPPLTDGNVGFPIFGRRSGRMIEEGIADEVILLLRNGNRARPPPDAGIGAPAPE